jgi:hypothetical protein
MTTTSVAIITGASQGIGRATAVRLTRKFTGLVLVARNRANLEETAELVRSAGAQALVIDADLSAVAVPKAIVEETLAKFGRIDALLNIAGAVPQADLMEMNDAQWEAGLALKLHGARRLTIAAWAALKGAKGSVVLMSGNSASFPNAPYAAVGTINAHRCARQGLCRSRHRRWCPGQQCPPWTCHDRPSSILSGALGASASNDRRRSYREIPQGGRYFALRHPGGDRRAHSLSGLAACEVDDRLSAANGRWRSEVRLTQHRNVYDLHG